MSDKTDLKSSNKRDVTLINILERMVEQIHVQDALLKDLITRQVSVTDTIENSIFHQNLLRDEVDSSLKQLQDSFNRYRSDMLTFVHEQDILRKQMDEVLEKCNKIGYSVEDIGKVVSDVDAGFSKLDKDVKNHIEYSVQKWDALPEEFLNTNRNISQINADAEKNLTLIQNDFKDTNDSISLLHSEIIKHIDLTRTETEQHFEKYQKHTTKRLLALDDMMSALETLLIRTEPPEKKPPLPKRIIRAINRFIRNTVKSIERISLRLKEIIINIIIKKDKPNE